MKAPYARTEQRRETRNDFPAGRLCIVDLIPRSQGLRTFGIVLNLSKSGMAIQTFRPLVAGQVAEIRHCFSKTPLYPGEGQVVWEKEGGLAGLRFLNGRLKNLPELHQRDEPDGLAQSPHSALPLMACKNTSSTDAFESTLHLLACCAIALTDATGVAIVLGDSDAMECRASVGIAPRVGTLLHPESGISGHSLRTGSVVLCNDAWADPRVNMAAARQLETRSILIVPITIAGSVVGLIEAFSRDRNHFDERHLERLQPLVTVLASVPELEAGPLRESPEGAPEPMPVVAAQDSGAVEGVAQIPEPEEPTAPAEIAPEPTVAAPPATEVAVAEPDIPATAEPSTVHRSRSFPLAGGIISALLIVLAAMAFFAFRLRTHFPAMKSSTVSLPNSQLPKAGAGEQGAVAAAKPEIQFDPPVINQNVEATFSVNVVLKNAKDILSAPMRIRYDPQKLRVITVAGGELLSRDGTAGTLVHQVDSSAGNVDITISRPLSAPGISGDGSLVTLTFLAKVPGRSQLQVNPVELRDSSSRATFADGAEVLVDVSSSPTKAGNNPAKPTTAKKELPSQPATADAKSVPRAAQPAAQLPSESKAEPEATPKASSSVAPEASKPEASKEDAGALVMEGVPPGSEVWLDKQPLTATAPNGKVAIRNIPPGTHHLRMSLHHYQYYDEYIDLKPGQILNIEPHTGGSGN